MKKPDDFDTAAERLDYLRENPDALDHEREAWEEYLDVELPESQDEQPRTALKIGHYSSGPNPNLKKVVSAASTAITNWGLDIETDQQRKESRKQGRREQIQTDLGSRNEVFIKRAANLLNNGYASWSSLPRLIAQRDGMPGPKRCRELLKIYRADIEAQIQKKTDVT